MHMLEKFLQLIARIGAGANSSWLSYQPRKAIVSNQYKNCFQKKERKHPNVPNRHL